MTAIQEGAALPVHELVAWNYEPNSDNKIHGDEIARQFGFTGGLVPGVGVYAYMTQPIAAALGRAWLERGFMTAKFLKPVYDGERVRVRATIKREEPLLIEIELTGADGAVRALGTAGFPGETPSLKASDFPEAPLPAREARRPPSSAANPEGTIVGSILKPDWFGEAEKWRLRAKDELEVYKGPDPACHPIQILQLANDTVVNNVEVGPWIHTASDVQHFGIPRRNEPIALRGRIAESYQRRGHEFLTLDLALLGEEDRPLQHIRHTAIVRLREAG